MAINDVPNIIRGETKFSGRAWLRPLDQITAEADILARFYSMLGQSRDGAADAVRRDNKNWAMFLGKHFLTQFGDRDYAEAKQSVTHTRYRREIIQPTIELLRAVMVKAFPGVRVKPEYEYANLRSIVGVGQGEFLELQDLHDADVAAWATGVFNDEMERTGEAIKQAELTAQVLVGGEAYRLSYTRHIPNYATEIRDKLLTRDQFYGDPKGTDLENFSDFEYIIIEEEFDAATIERFYGVKESSYSYDAQRRGITFDSTSSLSSTSRSWHPSKNKTGQGAWRWDQRTYKVHTIYYNFGNVQASVFGIKNTGKSAEVKYPLGREIVIVNYSKVVSDKVNPFWHGEFPITCYQASPLPCMARGLSEVEKIADDQVVVDIINNVVLWNALEHSNRAIMYEEGSVNPQNLKNEPGVKIPVRPGALTTGQIKEMEAADLNQSLYQYGNDTANWAREIVSGATPSLAGLDPKAGTSGRLYDQQIRSSMPRHVFKTNMMEPGHMRHAKLKMAAMQQWADFRSHHYAKHHDISQHQYMPEAFKQLFFGIELTSMAELPTDMESRETYGMVKVQNGIWDLEQFVQFTGTPMRPELRRLVRDVSLNHFIPGLPNNIQSQIRLQGAQLLAQQQQNETGQQGPNLAQGNPPPLPPGDPDAIQR